MSERQINFLRIMVLPKKQCEQMPFGYAHYSRYMFCFCEKSPACPRWFYMVCRYLLPSPTTGGWQIAATGADPETLTQSDARYPYHPTALFIPSWVLVRQAKIAPVFKFTISGWGPCRTCARCGWCLDGLVRVLRHAPIALYGHPASYSEACPTVLIG